MKNFLGLKEYSAELAQKLQDSLKNVEAKTIKGSGTFKVVATTSTIDRDGESILVEGWDFANYLKNPIILACHNYWDMKAIIGATTNIKIEGQSVVVEGVFADTEEGQYARKLYDDGMLNTVSVGFIIKERMANVITKAELLEISFVPVPANPEAERVERSIKAGKEFEKRFLEGKRADEPSQKDEPVKVPKSLYEKMKSDLLSLLDAYCVEDSGEPSKKAGAVLSKKNKALVEAAIAACDAVITPLRDLLAAAENSDDGKSVKSEDEHALHAILKEADKLIEKAIVSVKPKAK